jgi:hypothetical protein
MMKTSLGKKFCFAIIGTFGRYVTNLRGTFVENVKKIPKSTHPSPHYMIQVSVFEFDGLAGQGIPGKSRPILLLSRVGSCTRHAYSKPFSILNLMTTSELKLTTMQYYLYSQTVAYSTYCIISNKIDSKPPLVYETFPYFGQA